MPRDPGETQGLGFSPCDDPLQPVTRHKTLGRSLLKGLFVSV